MAVSCLARRAEQERNDDAAHWPSTGQVDHVSEPNPPGLSRWLLSCDAERTAVSETTGLLTYRDPNRVPPKGSPWLHVTPNSQAPHPLGTGRMAPRPLTSFEATVPQWELHGQAELQRQLGLPGRADTCQLGDTLEGQPTAQDGVQHGAAQAQAPVLRREALSLLEQLQRWGRQEDSAPARHRNPAVSTDRSKAPPVKPLLPRSWEAAALSRCRMSGSERPVSLCRSGPEKCSSCLTDVSRAGRREPGEVSWAAFGGIPRPGGG